MAHKVYVQEAERTTRKNIIKTYLNILYLHSRQPKANRKSSKKSEKKNWTLFIEEQRQELQWTSFLTQCKQSRIGVKYLNCWKIKLLTWNSLPICPSKWKIKTFLDRQKLRNLIVSRSYPVKNVKKKKKLFKKNNFMG